MAELTGDEVEEKIEKLSEQIKTLQDEATTASNSSDDENLSKLLMRLARVNTSLGRLAAYAKYIARNADRAARRHRASETLTLSVSAAVNKSELQAELNSEDQFTIASKAQLVADQADDLTFRTDTFLRMSQSRLSLLARDKR